MSSEQRHFNDLYAPQHKALQTLTCNSASRKMQTEPTIHMHTITVPEGLLQCTLKKSFLEKSGLKHFQHEAGAQLNEPCRAGAAKQFAVRKNRFNGAAQSQTPEEENDENDTAAVVR
eukprot:6293432-Amphidinium_carterae.1